MARLIPEKLHIKYLQGATPIAPVAPRFYTLTHSDSSGDLFLSKEIVHVESEANPRNTASLRVLEKAGFTKEGAVRKSVFLRGQWQDGVICSILREE